MLQGVIEEVTFWGEVLFQLRLDKKEPTSKRPVGKCVPGVGTTNTQSRGGR